MRVEVCKHCGGVFDPEDMLDGVCYVCCEEDDSEPPEPTVDFDNLYEQIDKDNTYT